MAGSKKLGQKVDDRHLRLEYLGGRCAVCRRSVKAVERRFLTSKCTFEFNHIDPSRKSPIYEKLIRRVLSAEQLDELDKCNLLCRICHGIWTNQRIVGSSVYKIPLPDGRVVKKKVSFHGLMEIKKGRPSFYFFTDEPCHLEGYGYRLGNSRMVYRAGFELEKQLLNLLRATRRRRLLRIWDRKGLVFKAERVDETHLRVEYAVRFSIIKFEGQSDKPDSPWVWVRNGRMIIEGQGVRNQGQVNFGLEYHAIEDALAERAAKNSA